MSDSAKLSLHKLIKNKPYLVWYTKNFNKLSKESIVESVLNFGDWSDFLDLKRILGLKRLSSIFSKVASKKRSNFRKESKNYFSKYFNKYA